MTYFRLFYIVAAGLGYFYQSSIDKWRKNSFKVSAEQANTDILERVSKYGMPVRDVIVNYQDFQVSYDAQKRVPNWTLEHLTKNNLQTILVSEKDVADLDFLHRDSRIYEIFQPAMYDYDRTGFHPIQLANKENHRRLEKCFNDTYSLLNTVPGNFPHENSAWHCLETFSRYLTHCYKNVYVLSGPLYQPKKGPLEVDYQLIGPHRVAVPTDFFKALICETDDGLYHIGCYIVPNKKEKIRPLDSYRVPLSQLENTAGFMLFKDIKTLPVTEALKDVRDFNARRQSYMKCAGLTELI